MRRTKPPRPNNDDRLKLAGTRPHAVHRRSEDGKKYGVPRWLRRYCKRYGDGDLEEMRKLDLKMKPR